MSERFNGGTWTTAYAFEDLNQKLHRENEGLRSLYADALSRLRCYERLETMGIVATDFFVWTPGEQTLCNRLHELNAALEVARNRKPPQ